MSRITALCIVLLIAVAMISTANAIPSGKTIEFKGGGAGKVIFDGTVHSEGGKKCNNCHTKPFKMQKGANKITMAEINAGNFCGKCHNGETAFKATECAKCHKK